MYPASLDLASNIPSSYDRGSVLSYSSKSHKSLFNRFKRLINHPFKKTGDYQLSTINPNKNSIAPILPPSEVENSNENLHIPFLYGLKNCGNTCYINAIIQCLCHTEQLALYILQKTYENDMHNVKNVRLDNQQLINLKTTKSFIHIFQSLWNNSPNTTKLLYDFKSIIANLNKQYSGNEQNDAQEFLLFFINTIHEELNLGQARKSQQPNRNSAIASSQSSAELARRAWSDYTDANQSIMTSTFSALLHSTLHCNQCEKESKTFEPYLLLSLPIPQKIIKPVFITVVFLNQSPKQLQIGLCLVMTNTVKDVREIIAQQSNIDPNYFKIGIFIPREMIQLFEGQRCTRSVLVLALLAGSELALVQIEQHNTFSHIFHDAEPISRLTYDVYAIQFPSSISENNEHVTETSSSSSFINLLVLNRVCYQYGDMERFGAPIAVRVSRQSTYRSLQLSIIKAQRSMMRDEVMKYAQEYVLFQLTLVDQFESTRKQEYPVLHNIQLPLYLEKIDDILHDYNEPGLGPSHIELYANWHEKSLNKFFSRQVCIEDKVDIHQSVAQARTALHQPTSISLADCFSLFTQSESLNHDDAWMCTHCHRKENGSVKNLKIYSTPSVLIIHLKRFCQTKRFNSKLNYPVEFPLVGLNVKQFLSGTNDNEIENDEDNQCELYDLFAVCNHRGSMSNGHYTAYCKNPLTKTWFCYDDHLVTELDPSHVCTPDAYILFYNRRQISSPSSQQQIDSITNQFDEDLNIDHPSPIQNNQKSHYILQPPFPLPRRLSSEDEFSSPPHVKPRTHLPQYETQIIPSPVRRQVVNYTQPMNDFYTEIINPYHHEYSKDESESNVIYHTTILQ